MSNYILPSILSVVLLAGVISSCKHDPVSTGGPDTTKHDTTRHDTTGHDSTSHDTTGHGDTTRHVGSKDTTSHDFTWQEYTIPNENNMTGVTVLGSNSILAVNYFLYWFDGYTWTKVALKDTKGNDVSALSGFSLFGFREDDAWLVLADEVLHINSFSGASAVAVDYRLKDLGVTHYPSDGMLRACWGSSSNDMFFVGDTGTIIHFDGTHWTKFPKVTTENLQSVWGTSHNDVWACGYNDLNGHSIVLHFDGSSWSEDAISSSGIALRWGLGSIWASDSAGHRVVSTAGSTIFHKTDNGSWRSDSGLVSNQLGDGSYIGLWITGNSANDLIATGSWGFVAHWSGRSWHRYDQFYSPSSIGYFPKQACVKNNTACVVGIKGSDSWILVGQRQ